MEDNNQQSSAIMELGEGPHHSYAQDYSSFKRKAFESEKRVIEKAIAKSFDPMIVKSNSPICIADLAYSTGPHTFLAIQTIIEVIQKRYDPHPIPELHVYFNNQLSNNDLNKLFSYLPPNRPYFASAVPGCFRGRLFPKRTLHFVHSASSLHWLSQLPNQVRERGSRAWNRGRIHHTNAAKEVREAYEAEYEEEFEMFLSARAEEIVENGLMLLHIPTVPDEVVHSDSDHLLLPNRVFDLLGSALMDMAQAGIITEEKVDSFNIPIFYSSVKGVKDIVDRNEWFSVEKMEAMTIDKFYAVPNANKFVSLYRAVMQNLIETHFGGAIVDELFDRFTQKVVENPDILNPNNLKILMLFVLLKRKLDPY